MESLRQVLSRSIPFYLVAGPPPSSFLLPSGIASRLAARMNIFLCFLALIAVLWVIIIRRGRKKGFSGADRDGALSLKTDC